MGRLAVLVSLLLGACGAAAPRATTSEASSDPGACAARAQLAQAEDALGGCRAAHASDPGWPARGEYDTTVARLSAHLASLDPPRALSSDDVQPLAEEIWELLDQLDLAGGSPERARAETAAERLLRERDVRAAPGAAIEALDAVTQIAVVADPTGGIDPCAAESLRVGEARIGETACEARDDRER
jgi:hypothetical protein